ncbi:hypothetical protein D6779_11050 [Candidatus Parcubacteria bacterium]|nr:MAG: hypothetical protein D6779_11050 [Candidatus Parcubacteria bacterium]
MPYSSNLKESLRVGYSWTSGWFKSLAANVSELVSTKAQYVHMGDEELTDSPAIITCFKFVDGSDSETTIDDTIDWRNRLIVIRGFIAGTGDSLNRTRLPGYTDDRAIGSYQYHFPAGHTVYMGSFDVGCGPIRLPLSVSTSADTIVDKPEWSDAGYVYPVVLSGQNYDPKIESRMNLFMYTGDGMYRRPKLFDLWATQLPIKRVTSEDTQVVAIEDSGSDDEYPPGSGNYKDIYQAKYFPDEALVLIYADYTSGVLKMTAYDPTPLQNGEVEPSSTPSASNFHLAANLVIFAGAKTK